MPCKLCRWASAEGQVAFSESCLDLLQPIISLSHYPRYQKATQTRTLALT